MNARSNDYSEEVTDVLNDGETVHWYGHPHFGLYVADRWTVPVTGVLLGVLVAFLPALFLGGLVGGVVGGFLVLLLLGMAALLGALAGVAWVYVTHDTFEYVVTDQRLLTVTGVVGRDYSSLAWPNVSDVEVRAGTIDGVLETGTVVVHGTGGGLTFRGVGRPYRVVDHIEDARAAAESG